MRKKAIGLLWGFALACACVALMPLPVGAQASCRDAAIYWWDLGWAPFTSAFSYLQGPVDPFSAEWSGSDCGCWWYGGYWDEGNGDWYYPRWEGRPYTQVWRAHRTKDSTLRITRFEPFQMASRTRAGERRPAKAPRTANRLGKASRTWTGYPGGGDASVASSMQGMAPSAGFSSSSSGGVTVSPGSRKSR